MEMTLQHQKILNPKKVALSDGRPVRVGEDGKPYAKDGILIIADGLGGRGGFHHLDFNRRILESDEAFYDVAFGQGFEKAANDEEFKKFVMDSFSEFFDVRENYFARDPGARRTSAYFASRLVTAIALYYLRYDETFSDRERLFQALNGCEEQEREQNLKELGENFAKKIKNKLTNIAERLGFKMESKTMGNYLLPSTLVVALTNEHSGEDGNYVDVLYMWAGDSRGYLWNKDGLAVMTDDHEKSETMTNLISLTKEFTIEARLCRAEEPVVLFNATDGCYKCQCFGSPLDLEYGILTEFSKASDFEEASQGLDKLFGAIGAHDDGNTIALTTFGYEGYAEFKAAVEQRINDINETILKEFPDIFVRDYKDDYERADGERERLFFVVKKDVLNSEEGLKLVIKMMKEAQFASYMEEIDKPLTEADEDIRRLKEGLENVVSKHWVRKPCLRNFAMGTRNDNKKKKKALEYCKKQGESILNCLSRQRREREAVKADLDEIEKGGLFLIEGKEFDARSLKKTRKNIISALNKIFDRESKLYDDIDRWNRNCEKITKDEGEEIKKFAERLKGEEGILEKLELSQELREELNSKIGEIKEAEAAKRQKAEESFVKSKGYAEKFWQENSEEIIKEAETSENIPQEIKDRCKQIAELKEKTAELQGSLDKRQVIYDKYEENYNRYFKESKI